MPVYAYDVPPHLYVRLAPGVGADLAVVGPLPEGGYEQLLGDPRLVGGLQQSTLVQIFLDLTALPGVTPGALWWTATAMTAGLFQGGTRHLAVVLPPAAMALADELRAQAAQHAPALAFACFSEQASAVRWLATRQPGVGASATPDEVRADAQQGRWLDAVARYRALYACPLATAVEVVEALLAEAPRPEALAAPASLIPSTEQPDLPRPEAPVILPAEIHDNETSSAPYSGVTSEVPPPLEASPAPSQPTTTRASLADHAIQAAQATLGEPAPAEAAERAPADELATPGPPRSASGTLFGQGEPMFQEELTVARSLDEALFPPDTAMPEEDLLEARQRGSFDLLLRTLFSKTWYVASEDGETVLTEILEGSAGVLAHDTPRASAPLALGGARLNRLLDDSSTMIRFSPDTAGEVTLRRHQLPFARSFLSGLRVEALLPSLSTHPEARSHCMLHGFLVLLERGDRGDRPVLVPGPSGGPVALVFTLLDALLRFLQARPAALAGRPLCSLAEQGDSLLEKLMTLPIDGVLVNPAGPTDPLFLPRDQILPLLAPEPEPAIPDHLAPSPPPPRAASLPPAAPSEPAPEPRSPSVRSVSSAPRPASVRPEPPAPEAPRSPSLPPSSPSASPSASTIAAPASAYLDAPASAAAMSVRDGDLIEGPPPLLHARSLTEAHFYLDVRHQERQDRYQWSENRGPSTIWIFNTKGADGRRGRFDFAIPEPAPSPQDGYFGPGPSPLFGPVELLTLAGSMARGAAGAAFGLTPEELADSTRRMELAYILVMEALRFYEGEEPPPAALRTDEERRALAKEPERFRRGRVEELARSYWLLASQLGEALRGTA